MLFLVEQKFASNQDLLCLWCLDSDVLGDIGIANKNSFLSLVDIKLDMLFARYENTCSIAKNLKINNVLLVFCLCLFWNNCIFGAIYRKPVSKVV